mmetsp:Transcript_67096/g.178981  ORF Transcript_67096/g.178981 Transcript_67096/m.178981 type:complete len:192 (+) Transcript_67096:1008-1583(+)
MPRASLPWVADEIQVESACSCSGDVLYQDMGEFKWTYDLLTCTLKWIQQPTLEDVTPAEVNTWRKDGICTTRPECDPENVDRSLARLQESPPGQLATAAQVSALKLAKAVNLIGVAVRALVLQASLKKTEPAGAQFRAGALSVVPLLESAKKIATDLFAMVKGINPNGVQPFRAIFTTASSYQLEASKLLL